MELVKYLYEIYGYDTPIFIKDVRIGRKSKTAIREEFYRYYKKGLLNREGPGIYSVKNQTNELTDVVTFEKILEEKFLYKDIYQFGKVDLFVNGYYSGNTFLNQIHLTNQVPAILEITTNNTSSNKRFYEANGRLAIIRKPKIEINYSNYKILQFLDMFYFLSIEEIKNQAKNKIIKDYIKKNKFEKRQLNQYLKYYGFLTVKKITEGGLFDAFI